MFNGFSLMEVFAGYMTTFMCSQPGELITVAMSSGCYMIRRCGFDKSRLAVSMPCCSYCFFRMSCNSSTSCCATDAEMR